MFPCHILSHHLFAVSWTWSLCMLMWANCSERFGPFWKANIHIYWWNIPPFVEFLCSLSHVHQPRYRSCPRPCATSCNWCVFTVRSLFLGPRLFCCWWATPCLLPVWASCKIWLILAWDRSKLSLPDSVLFSPIHNFRGLDFQEMMRANGQAYGNTWPFQLRVPFNLRHAKDV